MDPKPLGSHKGRRTCVTITITAGLNAKTLGTPPGHTAITIARDGLRTRSSQRPLYQEDRSLPAADTLAVVVVQPPRRPT